MVKFPKISKKTVLVTSIILFAIALPFGMYFASVQTYTVLNPTNQSIFTPFYTDRADYTVYNAESGAPVYRYNQGDTPRIAFDERHDYPGISLTVSDPFLTDYSGTNVINETEALTTASNIKEYRFVDEEGKFKILTGFTLAFDFAVRTHQNFEINYYNYLIEDLVGVSIGGADDVFKKSVSGDVNDAQLPFGVLFATVNADQSGWSSGLATSWAGPTPGTIGFDKCLIPNPLQQEEGLLYGSQDDGVAWNEYDYLSQEFGNRKVLVVPELEFTVINNFLKYDYYKPVEGTDESFHILSESTQLGIVNVRQSIYKDSGFVIDMPTDYYVQPNEEPITDDGFNNNALDDVDQDIVQEGKSVYFTYTPNSAFEELLPFETTILGDNYLSTNITPSAISIDNFILPTSAEMKPYVYIQPLTIVKRASFTSLAYGAVGHFGNVQEQYTAKSYPNLPYGLKIEHRYAIGRILVDIAVLSENTIEYIPASGAPIEVTDLNQYGISEFGLTPTGVFEGGILNTRSVWEDQAGLLFLIIGIIIAVVIIITIVPILIFTRGGGGGSPISFFTGGMGGFGRGGGQASPFKIKKPKMKKYKST